MTKRIFFLLSFILFSASFSFSQSKKKDTKKDSGKIDRGYCTLGLGYGILSFKGDLGAEQKLTTFNNFRGGFNFNLEKRFGKILGVGFNGLFGKLSQSERSTTLNRNFESPLRQFGLNVSAQFDMKPETQFAPFISLGISSISFAPASDLDSAGIVKYNYWSDGSIRDTVETKQSKKTARIVRRDYTYETKLDTANNGSSVKKSSIAIPLTFGLKFKMGEKMDARLAATYNITQTDYIDGYVNGGNDSYVYLSMALNYTFMKKHAATKSEQVYDNIDFAALLKEDGDDDGVLDDADQCQHTPNGVQVDLIGCPLDSDNDGIPDYLDKEKDTKPGAVVNQYGVTMTDEMIALQRAYRDSVVAERVSHFYDAPSKETLKDIDKQISQKSGAHANISAAIPKTYQFADKDRNGVISSSEITAAIDSFFEGELDINVQTLLGLIDFFFEQ